MFTEIYTRDFTGSYYENSLEERRVGLQEQLAKVSQELHQLDVLYTRKAAAIYAINLELQVVDGNQFHALLKERLRGLVTTRDAVARQIIELRTRQQNIIVQTSDINNGIRYQGGADYMFVHELGYTRVNPSLMITEQDMYEMREGAVDNLDELLAEEIKLAA